MMITKPILSGLTFGGLIVVAALGLKFAAAHHLVSGEAPMRVIQILIGLMVAFNGNAIPKNLPPFRASESRRIQALRRTCGWLLTLTGLGFAAIWAVAPIAVAPDWSVAIMGAATLTVAGITVWTHFACRREAKVPH
ncbi:MAG TPA: hypothetical protein VKB71_09950 [Rhizomicrobium sp.]|nr:hypothetical protein [Rhizomicrobium sp.]